MSPMTKVEATPREDFGKNASRRLRHAGRVPGVVYGGDAPALPVTLNPRSLSPVIHSEASHTSILSLEIAGKEPVRVMLRDWQVDPVHGGLLHVDLVRITKNTKLKLKIPVHVTGEPKGVKVQGGIFEFALREVEVECLPDAIPESVTVEVTELTIGHHLRVSDLPFGPGIKVLTDPGRVVAHVVALKVEEEAPAAEVAEVLPAEPELIRKAKAEEETEEAEGGPKKKEKEKES
ncbi:MAG: 50S ribosomal protein L25 [Terriglobia bacterium]